MSLVNTENYHSEVLLVWHHKNRLPAQHPVEEIIVAEFREARRELVNDKLVLLNIG